MKTEQADVKSKGTTLGIAEFDQYESVAEANDALGSEELLEHLNAMIKTRSMNTLRADLTGGGRVTQKAIASAFMNATAEQFGTIQVAVVALNAAKASEVEADIDSADTALRDVLATIG